MRRATSWITALVVCGLMTSAIHGQESDAEALNALVVQQAEQIEKTKEQARAQLEKATLELAFAEAELAKMGTSKYWIGVVIQDASESLRAQLGMADRGALVIERVAEKSPSEEAGLKMHDVLTSVRSGEETTVLKEVADLNNVVAKSEKKPLILTVIRQGKSHDVTITPTERPQPKQDGVFITNVDVVTNTAAGNAERVAELLKELNALVGQQPKPVSVHFAGPVVMPPHVTTDSVPPPHGPYLTVMAQPGLPDNVTINITQTGKEPARVQYKQGEGKVWVATESELNTLPPEGRQALHIVTTKLLHAGGPGFAKSSVNIVRATEHPVPFVYQLRDFEKGPNTATGAITLTAPARATPTTKPNPTADRLSQLEKQLETLQKQQQEMLHLLKRTIDKTEKR